MTEDRHPFDELPSRLSTQEREEESPDRAFARALFGGESTVTGPTLETAGDVDLRQLAHDLFAKQPEGESK